MVGQYKTTVTVSGVTGSTPVCSKISFQLQGSSTEEIFDVADNNPNGSYQNVTVQGVGDPTIFDVKLYDANNNVIASKEGI